MTIRLGQLVVYQGHTHTIGDDMTLEQAQVLNGMGLLKPVLTDPPRGIKGTILEVNGNLCRFKTNGGVEMTTTLEWGLQHQITRKDYVLPVLKKYLQNCNPVIKQTLSKYIN